MDLGGIHLLVLDVDGVLTPGDVSLDDCLSRKMCFDIHDGFALKLWRRSGRRVALLSGRKTTIVQFRAKELGIDEVRQGVDDKDIGLESLLQKLDVSAEAACFVGDDIPDLPAMQQCGFAVAVANAVPTVKRFADYVTRRRGGDGAVAEVVELLMRKQRCWTPMAREA